MPFVSESNIADLLSKFKSQVLSRVASTGSYNDLSDKPTGLATEEYVTNSISTHNQNSEAHSDIRSSINTINSKIPSDATDQNQLTSKDYVHRAIADQTASFRGTYNIVNDLGLPVNATHQQVATALGSVISGADNLDYCNVLIPSESYSEFGGYQNFTSTSDYIELYVLVGTTYTYVTESNKDSLSIDPGTTVAYTNNLLRVDRYKYVVVSGNSQWEYDLTYNNSGFTLGQWDSINSGATKEKILQILANKTAIENLARVASTGSYSDLSDTPNFEASESDLDYIMNL